MSVFDQFGGASDDNGKRNRFSIPKGGRLTVGFMPALFSLRESNKWALFVRSHWGFTLPGNRGTPYPFQFACVQEQDYRTKMITRACPMCDLHEFRRQRKDAQEAAMRARGATDADIKNDPTLETERGWLWRFKPSKRWYFNVFDGQKFGTFNLSHRSKLTLDAQINKIKASSGFDPRMPNSLMMFDIYRTSDNASQMTEVIEPAREAVSINGQLYERPKVLQLTEEQGQQALRECQDLSTLVRPLTVDQIKALSECSEDPEEVEAIVNGRGVPTRAPTFQVPAQAPMQAAPPTMVPPPPPPPPPAAPMAPPAGFMPGPAVAPPIAQPGPTPMYGPTGPLWTPPAAQQPAPMQQAAPVQADPMPAWYQGAPAPQGVVATMTAMPVGQPTVSASPAPSPAPMAGFPAAPAVAAQAQPVPMMSGTAAPLPMQPQAAQPPVQDLRAQSNEAFMASFKLG